MSALFINNFALFIVATYKLPYHLLEPHELKYSKLFEYFLIFLVLYLAAMFFYLKLITHCTKDTFRSKNTLTELTTQNKTVSKKYLKH